MSEIGKILKNINSKGGLLDEEFIEEHYVPWAINKSLSRTSDGLLVAQEVNMRPGRTKYEQYRYYYHKLSKNTRRFGGRIDATKPKYLELVIEYYDFSKVKALAAIKVLSDAELQDIANALRTGGVEK